MKYSSDATILLFILVSGRKVGTKENNLIPICTVVERKIPRGANNVTSQARVWICEEKGFTCIERSYVTYF